MASTHIQPKTARRIHLIWGVVTAVLIVVVGVLFAVSCIDIYRSGDSPFSRASVWAHFCRIAVPVILMVAAIVGGAVLSVVLPLEGGRCKPIRDERAALRKAMARVELTALPPEAKDAMRRARTLRGVWLGVAVAVSLAAAALSLWWCLNPAHLGDNLHATDDVRRAAVIIFPAAAVALAVWVIASYRRAAAYHREAVLLKLVTADPACRKKSDPKKDGASSGAVAEKPRLADRPAFLWSVRGVIFAVAVVCIVLGIVNGGMHDVLNKAIRICTECIGLG